MSDSIDYDSQVLARPCSGDRTQVDPILSMPLERGPASCKIQECCYPGQVYATLYDLGGRTMPITFQTWQLFGSVAAAKQHDDTWADSLPNIGTLKINNNTWPNTTLKVSTRRCGCKVFMTYSGRYGQPKPGPTTDPNQ